MTHQPATEEFKLPERLFDAHNHPYGGAQKIDRYLQLMDRHHIEWSALYGLYDIVPNSEVLAAVRRHPDRLFGGCQIDPRDSNALDELRHYHHEGFRIIKIFPVLGFYPDDEQFFPVFDVVAELGMAIITHCGWENHEKVVASHFAQPLRMERLTRRYPKTPIILAHMGGIAGFLEGAMLAARTKNVFMDCTGGQGLLVLQKGGDLVSLIPPSQLLWGADGAFDPEPYRAAFVARGFGQQLDRIFYRNAREIFERIGAIPAKQCS